MSRGVVPGGAVQHADAGSTGSNSAADRVLGGRNAGAHPLRGSLERRNPTVKLALLFIVSLASFALFDPYTPAALYVLALFAVAATTRVPLRTLAIAHLPLLSFALGVALINTLSRPGTIIWQEGPFRITVEGLTIGLALGFRGLMIGVLSLGFIWSTDPIALLSSLQQHARLPQRITFALVAGYRMLQQLGAEWTIIRHAQATRAPLDRHGRPRLGLRGFGSAAFALLVVAIRRGELVARALESRSLGIGPRSVWRPVPLGRADAVFCSAVLSFTAGIIVLAWLLGLSRGPSALF